MAYVWQTWLADEFRAAGLDVIEVDGWKTRGRPASSGPFAPYALNCHHTAGTASVSNPTPGLSLLITGRDDLPGPIAHFATDYAGRIWVVAAGRANVNGANRGVPNIPAGDGNAQLLGNEVFTNGTQAMPKVQRDAVFLSSAVVLRHMGRPIDGYLYRHEDTSKTGKWDLGQLTTQELRVGTKAALAALTEGDDMPYSRDDLKLIIAETLRENVGDIAAENRESWWFKGLDPLVRRAVSEEVGKVSVSQGFAGAADAGRLAGALAPLLADQDNGLSQDDIDRLVAAVGRLDAKAVAAQLEVTAKAE